MASGDSVVHFLGIMPLSASFATPGQLAGGSTPAEKVNVWNFDDTVIEYLDFACLLEGYAGGGLTFTIPWFGNTQASGDVDWQIAIRRMEADVTILTAAMSYVYQNTFGTTADTAGKFTNTLIAFTNLQIDGWLDGELAIVRLRRNAPEAGALVGDAELWADQLIGRET